jgi:multidrug transporter EmrE-like cation transporter
MPQTELSTRIYTLCDFLSPVIFSFQNPLYKSDYIISPAQKQHVNIFEIPYFSLESLKASTVNILYAGIMSSGVAYTLQVLGQKNADPTAAAIIFSSESVFCAIGCMLMLGDKMTLPAVIGCLLILAGIILSQLNFKNKSM